MSRATPFLSSVVLSAVAVSANPYLKFTKPDLSSALLGRALDSGCGTDGPASCQNTSAITDLCCFESPGVRHIHLLGRMDCSLHRLVGTIGSNPGMHNIKISHREIPTCFLCSSGILTPPRAPMTVGPFTVRSTYLLTPTRRADSTIGLWPDQYVCSPAYHE
jgi:hypothetical protein